MRRLVSSSSALKADRQAEEIYHYPAGMLMEEAGIRLQNALEHLENEGALPRGEIVYLVGSGNNGGDGWVMARQAYLRGRKNLTVVSVFPPRSASCLRQAEWAGLLGIPTVTWPSPEAAQHLEQASVWVDCLWGTGLHGPVRPQDAEILAQLELLRKTLEKPVIAIDVPSGLWEGYAGDAPILRARWTLSPGPVKDFCYYPQHREVSGTFVEIPLAYPQEAEFSGVLIETSDLSALLPPIRSHDHKGKRGHVALVGGAAGMSGAVVLAARSAAAAGAGLISLGLDPDLITLLAPQLPAFQIREVTDLLRLISRYDAWVVGPGWGLSPDRRLLLESVWGTDLPLVLDADGFAAWIALDRPQRKAPTIFTPHPGEFSRLTGGAVASVPAAAQFALDYQITLILKGAVTWILNSDGRRAVWDGLEPALGTGGSGDCLAGVAGAFLAAGQDSFEASMAAVALHGSAGKSLALKDGWFTAEKLPESLARLSSTCRTGAVPL